MYVVLVNLVNSTYNRGVSSLKTDVCAERGRPLQPYKLCVARASHADSLGTSTWEFVLKVSLQRLTTIRYVISSTYVERFRWWLL